jgi:hypothetical protein
MLRYELHPIHLESTNLLLLPKLVPEQVELLSKRLFEQGYNVQEGSTLVARRGEHVIRISPAGVCRSNYDPIDIIAPVIPSLFSVPKCTVDSEFLKGMYVQELPGGFARGFRFNSRIERGSLWRELREGHLTGLTPDELAVLKVLLQRKTGICRVVTDFPVEGSTRRIIGRRQFYDSWLPGSEVLLTLRTFGEAQVKNCYLPEDGLIRFRGSKPEPSREWLGALPDLGEWCFYAPLKRERSN